MKSSQRSPIRAARLCGTGVNGAQTREPGSAEVTAKSLNTGPYQVLPDLTAEEYEALKADIAAHGIEVPIEVDERGNVLGRPPLLESSQGIESVGRGHPPGGAPRPLRRAEPRARASPQPPAPGPRPGEKQALAVQLRQVDPGAHRGRAGRFAADRLQQRQCRIWNSSAAFDHHGHVGPPAAGPKAETASACQFLVPFLESQGPTRWRPLRPPPVPSRRAVGQSAPYAATWGCGRWCPTPRSIRWRPTRPSSTVAYLPRAGLKPILVGLQPNGRWHQSRLYPTGLLRVADHRAEWWQAALEVFPQRRAAGPCGMGQAPLDSAVSQRHSRRWLGARRGAARPEEPPKPGRTSSKGGETTILRWPRYKPTAQ